MDFTLYWFMFPVSMLVATTAMLTGIGGAALFMPIFVLIFPLLGPEYPLASPVAAIAVALLTETFGFSSGFVGYYRKRLIDFGLSKSFLVVSVPAGIAGALLAHSVNPTLVKLGYGVLVLILAWVLLFHGHEVEIPADAEDEAEENPKNTFSRETIARDGTRYHYDCYKAKPAPTGLGGFLTGLLSVGMGEVVMPQLVKAGKVPVPVAAATSILIVIITVMCASFTNIATLINEGGVNAVPWHLVAYTIPGVIIGGQIGPRLQGKISSHLMERVIASVFIVIGFAMLWNVFIDLNF